MLTLTQYNISNEILQEAKLSVPCDSGKLTINMPTGRFFYDPWQIKEEYQNTVWDKILKTLPFDIGEARLIVLEGGHCYQSHSDIDDRYHLNIEGIYSFLVDLDTTKMYPTNADGMWYEMDTSPRHSAVNFGNINRVQLVVRKLLQENVIDNPLNVKISYIGDCPLDARFIFDDVVSKWLNYANKNSIITNFDHTLENVFLTICQASFNELKKVLPDDFSLTIL